MLEVSQKIALARQAASRDFMMPAVFRPPSRVVPPGVPRCYQELLGISDGPAFGEIVLVRTKEIEKFQGLLPAYKLAKDSWFWLGTANGNPLVIQRNSEIVYVCSRDAPESKPRRVATFWNFIDEVAMGPGYYRLVPAEGDHWLAFLTQMGWT